MLKFYKLLFLLTVGLYLPGACATNLKQADINEYHIYSPVRTVATVSQPAWNEGKCGD